MNGDELMTAIEAALSGEIDPELYDLSHGETDDPANIELATDDWTLVLEAWPTGIGFLALDDEPDSNDPAELQKVVRKAAGSFLDPLRAVNQLTDGQLASALSRTTDPLSNALAELLGEKGTPD